jgi:Tol biopolymer transport system component
LNTEAGQQLLHYRLIEKIGEGGMGVVWKAVDTQLDREVAIKVLPDDFALDPERLARFEREAKLLASINHPGIAVIHGLHQEDTSTGSVRFLAMELVPGEDLERRLQPGPFPVSEALLLCIQVAEALEAAHAQGVVHRDLKPANVLLTPKGKAKVLDFGLAKAVEADTSSPGTSPAMSPTITSAGTAIGVILGTAAYMSPEQARGKPVDKRTDIWAFGCLLFETLTGRGVFRGETVTDSMGAILHKEPDWSLLPADTPATVRLLLRRCLAKNPDRRLHDIADARIELEQAIADPESSAIILGGEAVVATSAGNRSRTLLLTAAGVLLGLLVGFGGSRLLRSPAEATVRKFDLGVDFEASSIGSELTTAISPDGSRVAFTLDGQLWVQALDDLEPREIDDTDGAFAPFWSPDGEQVGYFTRDRLLRVSAMGGSSTAICEFTGSVGGGLGAAWTEDGRVVYSTGVSSISEVSAFGGEPRELVPTDNDEDDLHEPHVLPGGRGVVFISHPTAGNPTELSLYADGEREILFHSERDSRLQSPVYAASGHLLFQRMGDDVTDGVWALPFSLGSLSIEGDPFLVVADAALATVSRDGTLVFVSHPRDRAVEHLVWVDRTGERLKPATGTHPFVNVSSLSPDGKSLAFAVWDSENGAYDARGRDLERGTETRLTRDTRIEIGLTWLPSGDEIVYSTLDREGTFIVPADGSAAPRKIADGGGWSGLTPDGKYFLLSRTPEGTPDTVADSDIPLDIWIVSVDGSEEPRPFLESASREQAGPVSPDGTYLAYMSNRSGRGEVYVTRMLDGRGRWQVSVNGGRFPRWSAQGDHLYFVEDGTTLMEVSFAPGDPPRLGKPVPLFDLPETVRRHRPYALSSDGRFIISERVSDPDDDPRPTRIKIVQNWIREFE